MMAGMAFSKTRLFVMLTLAVTIYIVIVHTTLRDDVVIANLENYVMRQGRPPLEDQNHSDRQAGAMNRNCTPAKQIIFIKTHKTASTTTNTLIQRYGLRNGLLFALPKGNQIFNENVPFSRKMMFQAAPPPDKGPVFNVIANHLRYNRAELEKAVPGAHHITILRHPVTKFESTFGYYSVDKTLRLMHYSNPLAAFMQSPGRYFRHRKFAMKNQLRNGMMFTLGFDHRYDNDKLMIRKYIDTLEAELDLVMITEYYDESLLLLKKLLCWDFQDILYIPKGYRSQNRRYEISDSLAKKILDWNQADFQLYEHFNRTFWRKIQEYGPDFQKDLAEFRKRQREFYDRCVDDEKLRRYQGREDALVMKRNAPVDCQVSFFRVDKFHHMLKRETRGLQTIPAKYVSGAGEKGFGTDGEGGAHTGNATSSKAPGASSEVLEPIAMATRIEKPRVEHEQAMFKRRSRQRVVGARRALDGYVGQIPGRPIQPWGPRTRMRPVPGRRRKPFHPPIDKVTTRHDWR